MRLSNVEGKWRSNILFVGIETDDHRKSRCDLEWFVTNRQSTVNDNLTWAYRENENAESLAIFIWATKCCNYGQHHASLKIKRKPNTKTDRNLLLHICTCHEIESVHTSVVALWVLWQNSIFFLRRFSSSFALSVMMSTAVWLSVPFLSTVLRSTFACRWSKCCEIENNLHRRPTLLLLIFLLKLLNGAKLITNP